MDSWLSCPCFCLMNHFGSYVKVVRKASTHLTEEPKWLTFKFHHTIQSTLSKSQVLADHRPKG